METLKYALKDGIARLSFDTPNSKANILSTKTLTELNTFLEGIQKDKRVEFLIIDSAKPSIFIAGADLDEIKTIKNKQDAIEKTAQGQSIFNKLEALPFTTVALIHGACMGGGTELVLACDYRVATSSEKTSLALPEVNIGVLPGFGGTQRLPRLLGLRASLDIILTGKKLNAKKALKVGLVDKIISPAQIDYELDKFIQNIRSTISQKRKYNVKTLDRLGFVRNFICKKALEAVRKKTKGHYPAPEKALEVVKKTFGKWNQKSYELEQSYFGDLTETGIPQYLIELFRIMEQNKKPYAKENAIETHSTGILGAGLMGGGIAHVLTDVGIPARIKDINNKSLLLALTTSWKEHEKRIKRRRIKKHEAEQKLNLISTSLTYEGFSNLDIVIEAIPEQMELKKKILSELEDELGSESVIASNTSSLSIDEMGTALKHPERFIGMHFFSPVPRMPLVEVIVGKKTNEKTINTIMNLARRMRKTPVTVKNCPGFLVNRILMPYILEASYLIEEGVHMQTIDSLAEQFGMPVGPITLIDEVGLDIGKHVMETLYEGYGERMKPSPVLNYMDTLDNVSGKKTKLGFYDYRNGKTVNAKIAQKFSKNSTHRSEHRSEDIINRMIFVMLNESVRCLDENIVSSAKDIDTALIMGIGFPPFRGGLLRYADKVGTKKILDMLYQFAEKDSHKNSRFQPCTLMKELGEKDTKFYDEC